MSQVLPSKPILKFSDRVLVWQINVKKVQVVMNSSLVDQDNGLQLCLAWSDCDTHHYPGQICSHKLEPLSHDPVLVQRGRQKNMKRLPSVICGFEYCQWNHWWSLLNGAKYFWSPLRWLWVHGGAAVASSRNIFLDSATSNCIWVHSVAGRPAVLGLLFVWVSAPGWWWWLKKKHYDDTLLIYSFLLRFNWSSFSILTSKYFCVKYFLVAGGGADPGRQYRPETGARHWSCSCLGTQRSSDPAQHWSTNSQKWGNPIQNILYLYIFQMKLQTCWYLFMQANVVVDFFFFKYFSVAKLFRVKINGLRHMKATFNLNIF